MRSAGRILYALDELLVVLPLDKTGTRSSESCIILRASALHRELARHPTELQLHRRMLGSAMCIGTLTNFGGLYKAYREKVPYTTSRREIAKLWQHHRICFLHGFELHRLKRFGKLKWRATQFQHFDAVAKRGDLQLRIGIGRGRVFSVDATPYYPRELLVQKTYQFLEGSLDEETRSRGA